MVSRSLFSSKNMEFETPPTIFKPLDELFHFNLDVCASISNHKCLHYMNKSDDALGRDWSKYFGPRTRLMAWMNPPYGHQIGKWVHKAYKTWAVGGGEVVALLPARTDTAWFQEVVALAPAIMFLDGRVKFLLPCVVCGTKTHWLYSQDPSMPGPVGKVAGVPVCDAHRPTHPDVRRWCSAPFPSCLVFFLKAAPGVIANTLAPLSQWGTVMSRISSPNVPQARHT